MTIGGKMNKYLEKIALTRLVKEIAKGGVTKDLSELASKGFIRPESKYLYGTNRGFLNRVLRKGILVKDHPIQEGIATVISADNRPVIVQNSKFLSNFHERDRQAFLLHELHEAEAILKDKAPSNIVPPFSFGGVKTNRSPTTILILNKGEVTGKHKSLTVLGKESNDMATNPYLRRLSKLNLIRQDTGEKALVSAIVGKRYGSGVMKGKELAKLEKDPGVYPSLSAFTNKKIFALY
jgi:hypothetical protein